MLDHMILTVSDVERSLAFYEAALKPLNIKFFMPYKGEDGHPDLWGFGDGKRAFFWKHRKKPSAGRRAKGKAGVLDHVTITVDLRNEKALAQAPELRCCSCNISPAHSTTGTPLSPTLSRWGGQSSFSRTPASGAPQEGCQKPWLAWRITL